MMRVFGPILMALIAVLSFGLHSVKIDAKRSAEELIEVRREIRAEQQALQILSAEWSHLNQPSKLQRMSARHLQLDRVRTTQIVALDDLPYLKLDLFDSPDAPFSAGLEAKPYRKPNLLIEIGVLGEGVTDD